MLWTNRDYHSGSPAQNAESGNFTKDGFPIFASVEETDEDGNTTRLYKQEEFFNPDDYKVVIRYHAGRAHYHGGMASGYQERAEIRYGVQIPLPFEDVVQEESEVL